MAQFSDWCLAVDEPAGNHFRCVMTGQVGNLSTGIQNSGYSSRALSIGSWHALLRDSPAAVGLIESKLLTTKAIRSGDLGQIYAMEWIKAHDRQIRG